jgi:hypothetical protein
MRRTPLLQTLARCEDHDRHATQSTDGPPEDGAHFRASDTTPAADPTLVGRELRNRRMNHPSGAPCNVTRSERRRTNQTYDER